jgi:hypothetical protein
MALTVFAAQIYCSHCIWCPPNKNCFVIHPVLILDAFRQQLCITVSISCCLQNCYDILCSALMLPENKQAFVKVCEKAAARLLLVLSLAAPREHAGICQGM